MCVVLSGEPPNYTDYMLTLARSIRGGIYPPIEGAIQPEYNPRTFLRGKGYLHTPVYHRMTI